MTAPSLRDLTLDQLREYDGTGPTGKIFLAVRGVIFDVSSGGKEYYGEGRLDVLNDNCFPLSCATASNELPVQVLAIM